MFSPNVKVTAWQFSVVMDDAGKRTAHLPRVDIPLQVGLVIRYMISCALGFDLSEHDARMKEITAAPPTED